MASVKINFIKTNTEPTAETGTIWFDSANKIIKLKQGTEWINYNNISNNDVTEEKLSTDLQAKVNDNVKTTTQNLSDIQAKTAAKNILIKDLDDNFYLGSGFYDRAILSTSSYKPSHCIFGTNFRDNSFGNNVSHNTFNNNVYGNSFGEETVANTFGNNIGGNTIVSHARHNTFGNNVANNQIESYFDSNQVGNDVKNNLFKTHISDCTFGNDIRNCNFCSYLKYAKIDGNLFFVNIESNATENNLLQNIHILPGIKGESDSKRLTISIPDNYLGSSRNLVIATTRTDNGVSTINDIIMYYADEKPESVNDINWIEYN